MATNAHDRRASQQSAKSSASAFSSRVTSKVKRLVRKFEDLDKNHGRETKRFKLPEKDSRSRFWSTPGTTQRYKHSRINRKSDSYRPISAIYLGQHYWGIPNQDGPADTVPPEPTKSNGAPVTTSPATTYTIRTARKNTRKTTPIHETDEDHSNPHPEENAVKRRATIFSRLASHRKKGSQQEPHQNASFGDPSLMNVGSPEDHALSSSAKRSAAARRSTSIRTGVKAIISIFNRRRGQDTTPPSNQIRATPGDVDEESVKKVSPDTVDNYRGVDFKRLESTSKKTRQSSSGFDYPSGILPPGFFDSRCSSIDIAAGIHSGQSSSKPLERKWILNPLYVQQSQRKHKSENSTAQQISSQNPANAAKSGGLYLQNLSASAISLTFKEIEKALAQRSSPPHKSIRGETKLLKPHNPSSSGNTRQKARAVSESDPGRSRRESPSSNTHDLTVTVSTIDQRAKANILYGRHSRPIRPSSDETWSSQFNLSASYSTNSVGSFAKFHTETSGLLEPDEADRKVRAVKTSIQLYEATPSPDHESSFPTRLPLSTRISLPSLQPALTRKDPKMVPKDSHVDDMQVRVGIELDPLSRRHDNLESHGNKTCEKATVSLRPDQARRTGTPIAAYWIEDRRLGNGAVYNSSTTSDPDTPGRGPIRNNNTPTKYIDQRTAPESYFLRNLPEPRIRVLTEDDADFYDDSSYEGDSESDNDELSAKDIAILDSAEDFRAHDSGLGGSHGGVSLPASHQSLESLPVEASSPQRIDESSSPTSIYSRSEESDGGSNHTIHVDSTPGDSSGSGDTLVSTGVQSSPSHSTGTPIHPIIGGAGEMTLGELAAYLAGPRAAENLQDGAASMTVHVPIMGMPPGNFRSPQPKSLIQVKEIRRLVFRWSSDSPIVEVKLERTPS